MKRFGRRIAASVLSLVLMAGLIPTTSAATAPKMMGDINGDGYADAGDALLALRCAVDDYALSAEQTMLGDVTKDGNVNAGDAVLILRYDAGLIDSLGDVPENDTPDTPPDSEEKPAYTLAYTEPKKNKEVYEALGAEIVSEYDWFVYVNGEEQDVVVPVKNDLSVWPYTCAGTVVEIYVDDEAQTVTVYEINHYLGRVTQVRSDANGEYITVTEVSEGSSLDVKTFYVDGYEVDDYVVYTQTVNDDGRNVIGKIYNPKTVAAEITAVKSDVDLGFNSYIDTGAGYLYAGDVKYIYSDDGGAYPHQDHIVYELDMANQQMHPILNQEYTLYLDPNGYVLAFERIKPEKINYLYVKDSDEEMGEWVAKVLLDDGSTQIVEIDEDEYDVEWLVAYDKNQDSNIDGQIFEYSVNDNGEYDLDPIVYGHDGIFSGEHMDEQAFVFADVKNGQPYIYDTDVIVDQNTIFIDDDNQTVYIGYDKVPNIDNADIAYVINGRIVRVAFVLDGEIYDAESTYFMLNSTKRETVKHGSMYYWRYLDAYVDGKQETVYVSYSWDGSYRDAPVLEVGTLYKATKSIDGIYFTEIEVVDPIFSGTPLVVSGKNFWLTSNESTEAMYSTDENTTYVYVEYDDAEYAWSILPGTLADMMNDHVDSVWVVEADDEYAELVYIFSYIPEVTT